MNIENIKIEDIKPYLKNAKGHDKEQIQQVADSIKRFGFIQPLVIGKNNELIIGHCRFESAKLLGLKTVPSVKVENLTDKEIQALRLADNRLNESPWDMNLVIEDLKGLDDDLLQLTGFDKDLLIEPDEKDDVVPENVSSISKLGDLYELNEHRVLCGDSTKKEDVEILMNGKKADMSFTSPPYNVGHNLGYEGKDSKYKNSDDNLDNYTNFIVKSTKLSLEISNEVFVNIQFLANNKKDVLMWLAELSDRFKDIFFWKKLKVQPAMAKNVANSQVEIIVLFGHNNNRAWGNKKWQGNFSNAIETNSASGENKTSKIHNATFPVELPLKFITHAYKENSIILDLFLGTGTTLIACEKTNRICYGMELDELYVDVIVQRWCDYTGNYKVKKNGVEITWPKK